MLKKIRFGVIGYGHIGKRHAEEILQHTSAELVAICDIDEKKNTSKIPFYNNIELMLQSELIDVVSICTPNGLHAEHGIKAMKKGKHIICEKPMACSLNYSTVVHSKNFETSLTILAENGTIEIGGQYMNEIRYCDIKNYEMPKLQTIQKPNDYGGKYQGSASNHAAIIQNTIQTLYNIEQPAITAREGKAVVQIIENIYKKHATNLQNNLSNTQD